MKLVFDTTVLSKMLDNDKVVIKCVAEQDYDAAVIPLATDAELRFGFAHGNRQKTNLDNYLEFKKQFSTETYLPSEETSKIYAEIATFARENGISLSNNDIWIAASSLEIGGKLITLDKDFSYLPQIRCIHLKI